MVTVVNLPQRLQIVNGLSPASADIHILPLLLMTAVAHSLQVQSPARSIYLGIYSFLLTFSPPSVPALRLHCQHRRIFQGLKYFTKSPLVLGPVLDLPALWWSHDMKRL
jgi:hypothetical protein